MQDCYCPIPTNRLCSRYITAVVDSLGLQSGPYGKQKPIAFASTTRDTSCWMEVEGALHTKHYCLRKLRELLLAALNIDVCSATPGLAIVARLKSHGNQLLTLMTELHGYPFTFAHAPQVAKRLVPTLPPPAGCEDEV